MWPPEVRKDKQQRSDMMEVSSRYGYTEKKKLKMNGFLENSHKNNQNCNGHEVNESSDSASSEDNQMISRREMSSGSSRSSSRDGMQGRNGSSSQDGASGGETRRLSQDGMLAVNGMASQEETMSAQGELQLQQDGSGRVQSRKQRTFTPEVSKDTNYWEKRRKNNEAARRSREKRRQYDMARERSVHDISSQNKYLMRQLCILKRRLGIPVNENIESPNEDSDQIDRDCRALLAALMSESTSGISGSIAMSLQLHCTSPNTISPASTPFSDIPNQNSMNGERHNSYNLSPVDSVTTNYSIKSFKSEPSQQPTASCLKAETTVPLSLIKQEPHETFSNERYNSNATPRSIDNFSNNSDMFENATSGVNMVRDTGDLLINGRRSFNTSPSPWYPMDHSISGLVVSHPGSLSNGINLTNHANTSTPSPTSSSSSLSNYPVSNGHSISQLPAQQEDEPLQLTVNKRARLDSDNSSEMPEAVEDLQWDRNSRNRLSSPTVNSNSHRSALSLPLKLRHKAGLPDHTIALTHSITPTTMISSTAFASSSVASLNHSQASNFNHSQASNFNHSQASNFNHSQASNFNHSQASNFNHSQASNFNHSQANGLAHLSEVALSQNGPLPLLKRDVNAQILHQRNSQCKENDSTYTSSGSSAMENGKRSSSDDDLSQETSYSTSSMHMHDSNFGLLNGESSKDPKYLERRRRNNEAARKCRENRKTLHQMREAQTSFYEMQNNHLKVKVSQQRDELSRLQRLLKEKQESGTIPSSNKSQNNDNSDDDDNRNHKMNL